MTYVRPRRRITRQSRWRDFSDFKELRIFMAGRLLVSSKAKLLEGSLKPAAHLESGFREVKDGARERHQIDTAPLSRPWLPISCSL